jgi:hypothetical protein
MFQISTCYGKLIFSLKPKYKSFSYSVVFFVFFEGTEILYDFRIFKHIEY